jgi:hypothetical protein
MIRPHSKKIGVYRWPCHRPSIRFLSGTLNAAVLYYITEIALNSDFLDDEKVLKPNKRFSPGETGEE